MPLLIFYNFLISVSSLLGSLTYFFYIFCSPLFKFKPPASLYKNRFILLQLPALTPRERSTCEVLSLTKLTSRINISPQYPNYLSIPKNKTIKKHRKLTVHEKNTFRHKMGDTK